MIIWAYSLQYSTPKCSPSDALGYLLGSKNGNIYSLHWVFESNTYSLAWYVVKNIFVFLLNYSKYGRYYTAVGSNSDASRISGLDIDKLKISGFVITALLVGVAGIILASLMDTGQQGSGKGFELTVIAAVILGGTSFRGGSGTIIGTILGVLVLKVNDNGIILMGIPQEFQLVFPGVILILAVYIDNLRKLSYAA